MDRTERRALRRRGSNRPRAASEQGHGNPLTKHDVLETNIVVEHDWPSSGVSHLAAPRCSRRIERPRGVVEPSHQHRRRRQRGVRQRPHRIRRHRHIAFDEQPALPAVIIDANGKRGVEARGTERRQEAVDRSRCGFDGRRTWPPTRTTLPAFATPPVSSYSSTLPISPTHAVRPQRRDDPASGRGHPQKMPVGSASTSSRSSSIDLVGPMLSYRWNFRLRSRQ